MGDNDHVPSIHVVHSQKFIAIAEPRNFREQMAHDRVRVPTGRHVLHVNDNVHY